MLPPPLATRSDSFARSLLDTRDAPAAGPAHVCEQEDGQTKIMSHCELTGSHSSPHSEGARASDRRAQSRGTHEAEKWVRGLEASSAPFDAVQDAEQLGGHREVTNLHHPASWVASHPGAGPDMSVDQRRAISTSAVCRVRSCHARAHCAARSQGLAKAPKNACVRAEGTQSRVENVCRALTTLAERLAGPRQSQIHQAFLRDSIMKMMLKLQPSAPPGWQKCT